VPVERPRHRLERLTDSLTLPENPPKPHVYASGTDHGGYLASFLLTLFVRSSARAVSPSLRPHPSGGPSTSHIADQYAPPPREAPSRLSSSSTALA
jgi:hypothetical protein